MIAKSESLDGCKILRVSGRIDFESALDFEHQINAMIQEAGEGYIIELSQVELLSSAGLRVMLSTAKRVAHRNASLALAAPSQVVRQVFEISHFNLLFKIFPSIPAAIADLKGITEVVPPEKSVHAAVPPSCPSGQIEAKPADLSVSSDQPAATPAVLQKDAAAQPESAPPVLQPSSDPAAAKTPTVIPLPSSSAMAAGSTKAPAATAVPNRLREGPAGQSPPSLPSTKQSAPSDLPPASVESVVARPPDRLTRREAKYPAALEVRAEGASYPCKDGDVIGTEGRLAQPFFSQIASLAPRHLLIGQLEDRWFVFTPKNVQHPFVLDGVVLRAGERKILQYVEHQLEFNGRVFGFRLVPQQRKEGFFSRFFGRQP
ncbi:MAG: anti-sigma factor antagonist [Verrucomicrobia bacterium]|nr:anti-sigma factor antagonist [Verrucomicrobiota bacterium]MBV9645261.1 anti-sigma factor antagonist [Verrucomicrobiota bacterium]